MKRKIAAIALTIASLAGLSAASILPATAATTASAQAPATWFHG